MTATQGSDPCVREWNSALRLADLVHGRLVEVGHTVAVAESLTGGLISVLLTEAPGTTVTFRGGLVVYATDLKHFVAGVRLGDLEEHGPVHSAVAEQLASGARERLAADYGIGVTGVAGPGAQNERPVGEVLIAIGTEAETVVSEHHFDGNRSEIRMKTAQAALADLLRVLGAR